MSTSTSQTFVPKDGVFAVLKIDPVASLAFLNDPEAIRAAEMVAFHEYVVFVPGTGQLRHPSISYRQEIVEFLMYGPAPDTPELGIDSAMCIPVSSTTDRRPVSREPLEPSSGQLPWSNCYLTAFLRETVRCATVIRDDPVLCRIGRSEIRRHDEMVISDQLRQASTYAALFEAEHADADEEGELADEAASIVSGSSEPSEDGASISDGRRAGVYFDPRVAVTNADDGLTAEEKEDAAELQFLDAHLAHRRPQEAPDDMLTVTLTHDLSRVSELRSPRLFYEEQEEIERIIAESMECKRRAAEAEDERLYAEKTAFLLAARGQASLMGVNEDATLLVPPTVPGPSAGVLASVLQFGKRCVSLMWH